MPAWDQALYGERGFYRQVAGPAGHFSTASQGVPQIGELLARAVLELMATEGLDTFVDVGCGRGELLEQVHRLGPHLRCIGVDIAVSYTHLRAHETDSYLVCRLLLEKK